MKSEDDGPTEEDLGLNGEMDVQEYRLSYTHILKFKPICWSKTRKYHFSCFIDLKGNKLKVPEWYKVSTMVHFRRDHNCNRFALFCTKKGLPYIRGLYLNDRFDPTICVYML